MHGTRLTLVFAKLDTQTKLQYTLNDAGYQVFGTYTTGTEALRAIRHSPPDIAVIDYSLSDLSGLRLCRILCEESICACVLLVPQSEKTHCEAELGNYAAEVLTKPVKRDELMMSIEVLRKSIDKILRLEREVQRLKDAAQARIFIDIAKGIIMESGIDEKTAYSAMRKASMDMRTPIKEIALKIIDGRLKWRDISV
jgi:AmiR/NasT family two-component response regulator